MCQVLSGANFFLKKGSLFTFASVISDEDRVVQTGLGSRNQKAVTSE